MVIAGLSLVLHAKAMVDCRVATGSFVGTCNLYGKKLHYIKEVTYDVDRKKLIIVKNLPKLKKKPHLSVITVSKMIERYMHISPPMRFKGLELLSSNTQTIHDMRIEKVNQPSIFKKEKNYTEYRVAKGDSVSKIAHKLNIEPKQLLQLNGLKPSSTLRIGEMLKVPYTQALLHAMLKGSYRVRAGDTLLSIAKMFHLSPKEIVVFNHIKDATSIRKGKVLKLPLPYLVGKTQEQEQKEDEKGLGNNLNINAFGTYKLRVTATAYTSHGNQTDNTPFLAAWNNHIRPGMRIIAVSRDLLTRFGMHNGTRVRIGGLRGFYRVRDKMNKRYRKRIDIYMGVDLKRALRWGKRSVMIYW